MNSNSNYLFFDTETTGLPLNYKAPVTDLNNWPRLVQIAWHFYDDSGILIEKQDHIIKPEGFQIPADASKIHGITTNRAIQEGKDLEHVIHLFNDLVGKAGFLVGHNIKFDEKIVGAELLRKNIKSTFFEKKKLCTMSSSVNYCAIPGQYGFKWPKLTELHYKLFGEYFEESHNASADIEATARCFWKMRALQLI